MGGCHLSFDLPIVTRRGVPIPVTLETARPDPMELPATLSPTIRAGSSGSVEVGIGPCTVTGEVDAPTDIEISATYRETTVTTTFTLEPRLR